MADKTIKEKNAILSPNLSQAKKASLLQVVLSPGWKTVEEIANEACLRYTQDIIRLDPESEDYDRVSQTRTLRARNATEFCDLLLRSIAEHANSIRKIEDVEEENTVAKVGEMFGIHASKPGAPADAIKNVFGIHPARPKKVAVK
jgi:hypothetical protein